MTKRVLALLLVLLFLPVWASAERNFDTPSTFSSRMILIALSLSIFRS